MSALWLQYHFAAVVLIIHLFTCGTSTKLGYFNFSVFRNFITFGVFFFFLFSCLSTFPSHCTCQILLILWGYLIQIAISFGKLLLVFPIGCDHPFFWILSCTCTSLMSLINSVVYYIYVHMRLFKLARTLGKRKALGIFLNSLYGLTECCLLNSCYTNLTRSYTFKFINVIHRRND